MALTFSNRRTIPAANYAETTPWLADVPLSALERAQLLAVVHLFQPKLTEAEMLAGDATYYHEHVQSFAETSVERWDIGDTEPQFQLWLCGADGGYLFDAGTTTLCAIVIQWSFDIDEELPESVRADIAAAAKSAVAEAPDSRLAEIDFEDRAGNLLTVEANE